MCEEVRVCVSERDIIGVVGCFKSEISSHVSGLANKGLFEVHKCTSHTGGGATDARFLPRQI